VPILWVYSFSMGSVYLKLRSTIVPYGPIHPNLFTSNTCWSSREICFYSTNLCVRSNAARPAPSMTPQACHSLILSALSSWVRRKTILASPLACFLVVALGHADIHGDSFSQQHIHSLTLQLSSLATSHFNTSHLSGYFCLTSFRR
jgi:hypothetical protein